MFSYSGELGFVICGLIKTTRLSSYFFWNRRQYFNKNSGVSIEKKLFTARNKLTSITKSRFKQKQTSTTLSTQFCFFSLWHTWISTLKSKYFLKAHTLINLRMLSGWGIISTENRKNLDWTFFQKKGSVFFSRWHCCMDSMKGTYTYFETII